MSQTDTPSAPEPAPDWGVPSSRTVTWHDPLAATSAGLKLSGLDYLGAMRDGTIPPPPISSLFDMSLVEVEVGRVVFTCRPDESAYNPIGSIHGGLVCTLLDSVCGCALHSTLLAGRGYTSIDLNVSYLKAVRAGGDLTATGTVVKVGGRVGFTRGEVVDAKGAVVATATSSLLVFDLPA